jgi:hypothetical protein
MVASGVCDHDGGMRGHILPQLARKSRLNSGRDNGRRWGSEEVAPKAGALRQIVRQLSRSRGKASCQAVCQQAAENGPPLRTAEGRKLLLYIDLFINNSPVENRSFRRRCARPQATEKEAKQPVI